MINPAKYYNPKPILSGSLLLVSMNVVMGYLVALRRAQCPMWWEWKSHLIFFDIISFRRAGTVVDGKANVYGLLNSKLWIVVE